MLTVPEYAERWERKLAWYTEQDIGRREDGGGSAGTLIVTEDDPKGGISSAAIHQLIAQIF
jgi:hypothetical protein